MLDGLYLEKLGIPASVICTTPFLQQGKAMAAAHGYYDYPLVEVFHPLTTASLSSIKEETERVCNNVLTSLLV